MNGLVELLPSPREEDESSRPGTATSRPGTTTQVETNPPTSGHTVSESTSSLAYLSSFPSPPTSTPPALASSSSAPRVFVLERCEERQLEVEGERGKGKTGGERAKLGREVRR